VGGKSEESPKKRYQGRLGSTKKRSDYRDYSAWHRRLILKNDVSQSMEDVKAFQGSSGERLPSGEIRASGTPGPEAEM